MFWFSHSNANKEWLLGANWRQKKASFRYKHVNHSTSDGKSPSRVYGFGSAECSAITASLLPLSPVLGRSHLSQASLQASVGCSKETGNTLEAPTKIFCPGGPGFPGVPPLDPCIGGSWQVVLQASDQLALGHGSWIDQGGEGTNGNSISSYRPTVGLLGEEVYNLHSSSCGIAKDKIIGVAFLFKCICAEPSRVKAISALIFARKSLSIKGTW